MRRKVFIILLCILLFPVSEAQEKAGTSGSSHMIKLFVTTDRELYITGETVNMKISCIDRQIDKPRNACGVLYSDVTDRYGNPAVQIKSDFNGTTGIASFRIPDTLASGIYYIRTFTPGIMNFPQRAYSYKRIAVVNPYGDFTPPGKDSTESIFGKFRDARSGDLPVRLSTTPESPARREKVRLELVINDAEGKPVEGEFALSVAKRFKLPDRFTPSNITVPEEQDRGFYPDPGGYTVSGTIWNRSTGQPLPHEPLAMGIAGKKAQCSFTMTDVNGEFSFRTDARGKKILIIQPLDQSKADYIIELKDPFSQQTGIFRAEPLRIDSALSVQIDRAIVAAQVSRIYASEITREEKNCDEARDFFGQPERSLNLSGYIELGSLREVIRELLPGVTVIRRDDKEAFRIVNKYPTGQFTTSPLVLLDGVPVHDISQLLAFRPADIEKIDIINTRYYYGSNVFEGIIHIVSRKGDLKLYEFPEAVFRQEHDFLQAYRKPSVPDYSADTKMKSRIPDTRNTLLWEPAINTDRNGTATLEFFTGDEPGYYDITLEGFSGTGIHVRSSETLVVRP